MSDKKWVVDVGTTDFNAAVVERSMELPVVVDFWAEWCGPCKTLGPALERHANEGRGRFLLAKVDVDKNPDLAQAFRVQSIPMVLAVSEGRVVDGFQGAVPEAELKAFLDRVAPARGGGGLEEAAALEEAGDLAGALQHIEAHLAAEPEDGLGRIVHARVLLGLGRTDEARTIFEGLADTDALRPEAQALAAQFELLEGAGDVAALRAAVEEAPDDLAKRIELGRALAAAGRHEAALEELLEAVTRDPHFEDDAARKAMLEVFEVLGPDHPLALDFRKRLQVVLF